MEIVDNRVLRDDYNSWLGGPGQLPPMALGFLRVKIRVLHRE